MKNNKSYMYTVKFNGLNYSNIKTEMVKECSTNLLTIISPQTHGATTRSIVCQAKKPTQ